VIDQARAEYRKYQQWRDNLQRAKEQEQLPKAFEEAQRILGIDLTPEQVQVDGPYIDFEIEGYRFRCDAETVDTWLYLQMICPVCEQTFYSEPIHSLDDLGQVLEVQIGKRPCSGSGPPVGCDRLGVEAASTLPGRVNLDARARGRELEHGLQDVAAAVEAQARPHRPEVAGHGRDHPPGLKPVDRRVVPLGLGLTLGQLAP